MREVHLAGAPPQRSAALPRAARTPQHRSPQSAAPQHPERRLHLKTSGGASQGLKG
ncbi:MAG: hypothetical protein RJA70_3864 [Pseudomonadota bacterium]|jgi:hypothetical protein